MNRSAFDKFAYGFLFILIDLRIMGFDILPDIIGYILFAVAFSALANYSGHFRKGIYVNIPLIISSFFNIYDKPVKYSGTNSGIFGVLQIPITIAMIVLGILLVYYLFQGIIEMAQNKGESSIANEANNKWKQFLYLQLGLLLQFVIIIIPLINILYIIGMLVIAIAYVYSVMKFMRICGEYL